MSATTTTMTTSDALSAGTYGSQDWQMPKKVTSRHTVQPVAQATTPVKPASPGKSAKAGAQQSLSPRGKPVRAASSPRTPAKSPGARKWGSPEEEWFGLLAQPGAETPEEMKRLKQLAARSPGLLEAGTGKDASRRGPLYVALVAGKPEAVAWLAREIPLASRGEPVALLEQLFDDPEVLIGASHRKALRIYTDSLPQESRDRIATHFASRLMRVPQGFQQVLRECGMLAGIPVEKAPVAAPVKGRNRKTAAADALRETNLLIVSEGTNSLMLHVRTGRLAGVRARLADDAGKGEALAQDVAGKNALMHAFSGNWERLQAASATPRPALPEEPAPGVGSKEIDPKLLRALRKTNPIAAELLSLPSASQQAAAVAKDGRNALMLAIEAGCPEGAMALLNLASADQQAQVRDRDGRTAMMLAAAKGYMNVIERLLALPSGQAQWENNGFHLDNHPIFSGTMDEFHVMNRLSALGEERSNRKAD
jgi:hypothetical protein